MSWTAAKLALPIKRLSIRRPATETAICLGSSSSLDLSPHDPCRSAARCSRRKSLGNAAPRLRSSASFARRSAMIWFSSGPWPAGGSFGGSFLLIRLHALLQARCDELVQIAVEDPLRVAFFHAGAQVLDARLVEHVGAYLVPPFDVCLGRRELVALGLALAQLQLVEARFQERHGFGAIAMLRAVILALYHDACGQMRDAHGGIGLVHVLAARAGRAIGVDAELSRVDLDFDVLVDFRIDEHARERSAPARVGVERRL